MPQPNLIFDVGMHRGEDTRLYLAKGFDVVAVEAMPELARQAEQELRPFIDAGQLTIENVAIAEARGPISFYANADSAWGTIHSRWADRNERLGSPSTHQLTVEAVRFDDLIARHGVPYYLKIDIEGADLLCLEALDPAETPTHVSLESDKVRWEALVHEFDVLDGLGYRRFKVVAQQKVHRQRSPNPPREGRHAPDWRPRVGASGLFGEEAPGRWLSRAAALAKYRLIFSRYRLYGDDGVLSRRRFPLLWAPARFLGGQAGWFDTHASR